MSVNGDMMVVRNGRSTSQVSVYNYPEHLNPFYEDDNHKRLRFWKINKGDKDGQGRRNSFSIGGLKDMWAFKSFRTKKKSSSLGINKTSESPPQMRRDIFVHENGYSTYDPRMRYTTGAGNGLGGDGNAFQRNVPYRTSLQDMRSEQQTTPINGIGFNRNDRYRSTIQTANTSGTRGSSPSQSLTLPPPRRYVYGGSVTPQPVRNNDFNSDTLGMISRGSSQASVASTNPFDDDEDDDDDVVLGSVSASSTPSKHPARKKRRAPPPPVPVHQIIKEESSSSGSTPSHKPSTTQDEERVEIHNLTAEIESFVKMSNSDSSEREHHSSATTTTTTTTTTTDVSKSPKQNGTIPKSSPTRKSNGSANAEVEIIITTDAEPLFIREDKDTEVAVKKDSSVKIIEKQAKSPVREVGHVEAIHVHLESPRSSPEKTEPSRVSTFRSEVKAESPDKNARRPSKDKVVAVKTIEVVQVHKSTVKPDEELKIMESPEKPPIAAKPNIPRSPIPVSPKLAEARLVTSNHIETPDTPAMRRREIKIDEDLPSSPEMDHREVGIEVDSVAKATAKPQEVTIKISRVKTTLNDSLKVKEERSTSDIPVPAVREHRPQTSPLPAVRKVINTEGDGNIPTKQESSQVPTLKGIEVEEKISNLSTDVPTTISELQISETELNRHRVEEPSTSIPATLAEASQLPMASTSNTEAVQTASIEKPPRAKHFDEEVPENIYRPRPSQWKESTLAPLEPVPPEKRRSVKQIIESINRSQRLLNGRKEDEADIDIDAVNSQRNMSETNTNAMEQNLKSLAESQREMKRMLEELEGLENVNEHKLSNKNDENFQGILDTIVSTLARETAKNNNADVFKKCTITKEVNNASRESSPTSCNLDWNPVPKPKRTKNRSPELEVKKNNNN